MATAAGGLRGCLPMELKTRAKGFRTATVGKESRAREQLRHQRRTENQG
jgi:hypothetical protein